MSLQQLAIKGWTRVGARFLPFADAASVDLPLGRLLRLSLFQVSVGMALALLNGTLNRVMIVELAVPAWLVSLMVALPIVFAPLRALVGHKSDNHFSALGWKRVPYIWFGSLMMFGGLAIIPFAVLVLIGLGGGLFAVCTLTEAMGLDVSAGATTGLGHGIALGAFGAVQATAMGLGVALGGGLRDLVSTLVDHGVIGEALNSPVTGYGVVYNLEILLLFATLIALGPLVRRGRGASTADRGHNPKFGLAEFPG